MFLIVLIINLWDANIIIYLNPICLKPLKYMFDVFVLFIIVDNFQL